MLEEILSRFTDVSEETDGGYLAVCPGHSDSRPSLRIWRGDDGKVRLTCRAGCATANVIRAVGLSFHNLFNVGGDGLTVPKTKPVLVDVALTAKLAAYVDDTADRLTETGHWPAVACAYAFDRFGLDEHQTTELMLGYDDGRMRGLEYTDADGKERSYRSRAFRQFPRLTVPLNDFNGVTRGLQGRDLSGKCPGRWVSLMNPEGMRWAPYGVFRGSGGYGVTLVTEGPGDGLTGVSVGYDVVMVRGASLAASPELVAEIAEGLKGWSSQVIACGDNDTAGREFNRRLSEGLKPYGIEVHALPIPDLGPKTDLTKWRESNREDFPNALHNAVSSVQPVQSREASEQHAMSTAVADRTGADFVSRDQGEEAAKMLGELTKKYGETHAINAYALVAWTDGRIKFAPGLGFHVWNGVVWEKSAVKVRQEIHRMGAALALAGETTAARGFLNTTGIDSLMTELRSVPSVHVPAAEFDARPELLSFANGVVDLRTGNIRPHDKRDMLTVSLPHNFDPNALAPRWEAFLAEIFPGMPYMTDYMRRLTGYGITGSTSEQCFAVMWGKGANGKSVFTDTLTEIFQNVTETTPFATFEDKGGSGGIPNDIAALRGARLVMASEGESGKPMSEAVLKRVTGKDKVTARFLRQEFFTFSPTFLIMLATNHKPRFKGQDEGLWRRVKLIPFTRYFAPNERDYDLDKKLLAETAGIVAWAVRGAVEWYAGGLQDPEAITTATRDYRATSDALAGFFPGELVASDNPKDKMLGADAFNAYLDWCECENLPQKERWRRTTFYAAMEERGINRTKTNNGIALIGVKVATLEVAPSGPGIFA